MMIVPAKVKYMLSLEIKRLEERLQKDTVRLAALRESHAQMEILKPRRKPKLKAVK